MGDVTFIFGMDVTTRRLDYIDDQEPLAWTPLERPPRYKVRTKPCRRHDRVKQRIVDERQYKEKRLEREEVAETTYRPQACSRPYRMIIVRKHIQERERGQLRFFPNCEYLFYITNDWTSQPAEIVFSANDRCNQENLVAQLGSGVRALRAPVDNLLSNWAYMVMASLAWNLKAWLALWTPPSPGRWHARHRPSRKRSCGWSSARLYHSSFASLARSSTRVANSCIGCWRGTPGRPRSVAWPPNSVDRSAAEG